ncbi:MAG TPA: MFS transporter [Hyphomonadaceae bacterium]|jgi:predicted MFS family arabinose efflux permease|nr:MFS transporter [Hyphomonadaceae bacterium]
MSTGSATADAVPGAVPQKTTAYAWLVLFMLAFIYIFNFLDRQLMSTVIESIKKDTGFTDAQMGLMTGFYFAIVYTTMGVIVGFLADRTSRRNILFVGAVLWSGFTALCGMAHNYPTMLAARVGVGVGEAAGAPPSYSIISDYFPAEKRGIALALFSMGVPLGQSAAIAFGAQIDIHWGWRNAFIGIGIAGVIASIIMLLIVREPKRGAMDPAHVAAVAHEKSSFGATFWQFISRPVLLWTALGCGLSAFVGYAALNWNAPFLLRVQGMTREELSVWYALMILISIGTGTLMSGAIVDWMSKRSRVWYALTPLIAMAAAAPFWYWYTQTTTWQMALLVVAFPTFLNIFYLAPALALVNNSVKPSQRTMSSAILLMVLNFIGLGGGPTMVGTLSTDFSKKLVEGGLEAGPAAAQGLREALMWVTPFFAVAVLFLVLQTLAIGREVKEGKSVRDGGFRVGIILLLVGAAGLYLRYQASGFPGAIINTELLGTFGGASLETMIGIVMDVVVGIACAVFTLGGLWLVVTGLMRKKEPAAA